MDISPVSRHVDLPKQNEQKKDAFQFQKQFPKIALAVGSLLSIAGFAKILTAPQMREQNTCDHFCTLRQGPEAAMYFNQEACNTIREAVMEQKVKVTGHSLRGVSSQVFQEIRSQHSDLKSVENTDLFACLESETDPLCSPPSTIPSALEGTFIPFALEGTSKLCQDDLNIDRNIGARFITNKKTRASNECSFSEITGTPPLTFKEAIDCTVPINREGVALLALGAAIVGIGVAILVYRQCTKKQDREYTARD